MNIWFFNHYAVPTSLYPLARPYHFANHLQKKGHKVTIFAASSVHLSDKNLITDGSPMKAKKIDGLRYVFLKARNYEGNGLGRIINFFEYTARLFTQTGKFQKPDVIMATSVHPFTCVAGILIAKKYHCPCVVEIADLWPLTLVEYGAMKEGQLITRALYALEHWIYKKADAIVFTMFGGKDYIVDKGWDLDRTDTFKVMYTGSMGVANSVQDILDAAILLKEHKEIQFFLYGAGYQEEDLKKYKEEHHIDNVHFKGRVNKKYIPGILSRGSLNMLTGPSDRVSEYGMSMNKMFDYMASGHPTLSNIQTRNDIFVDNHCGMTIEAGSPQAMADGILKFAQMDPTEYETYCHNATETVKEYDFGYLTDRLEEILKKEVEEK